MVGNLSFSLYNKRYLVSFILALGVFFILWFISFAASFPIIYIYRNLQTVLKTKSDDSFDKENGTNSDVATEFKSLLLFDYKMKK